MPEANDTASVPRPRTLTFLFTDIEGSTRRWEADRAAMSAALARHDAILRAAIESQGGTVFKTVGDAFCAVFADPVAALGAAVAAQRALGAEDWGSFGVGGIESSMPAESVNGAGGTPPTFSDLRVRMALRSGLAEERDGDYFGPTLNRVARLLSAGHGGQVLLSAVTEGLLSGHLPPGVMLRDLGEHRLKDLSRAERVWQLAAEGLEASFPPLRGLDARPHNLPVQPTALIGREAESVELERLLRAETGPRLVTLTGPGGTGKTRLALQAAADLLEDFEDGVFLVDLAPIVDAGLVPTAVAAALQLVETPGEPIARTVRAWLARKQLLLVLDNFEQILPGAPFVADLLGACPRLRVLVTSRAPLRLAWEHEYPLAPLPVPERSAELRPEDITRFAAIQLFVQRAVAVRPGFEVTPANAAAIAQICVRLDGLPLAVELAAARVRGMSPQAILDRLDQQLRLLADGGRDLPERQQTMRAAVAWSYKLLTADEQRLFRWLAVFAGGCTLEAAEAVCAADGAEDVWVGLPALVEHSLLRTIDDDDAEPRYLQLETLRAFGMECLSETGEAAEARNRHMAWCADLAASAAADLEGPGQPRWLDLLDRELDNLRAALDWSLRSEQAASGLRIAADLGHFWYQRLHTAEARQLLEPLLGAAGEQAPPSVRSRAWRSLGSIRMGEGHLPEAGECFAAARAVAGEDDAELARGLTQQAWQAWAAGEGALATDYWRQAEARMGSAPRPWDKGLLEMVGCMVSDFAGDLDKALEHCYASVAAFQAVGDPFYLAMAYNNLGWALSLVGRPAEAAAALTSCRELAEAHGYIGTQITCLDSVSRTARAVGDMATARQSVGAALALGRQHGIHGHVAVCLLHLGDMAMGDAQPRSAALLLGAAEAAAAATGQVTDVMDPKARQALALQATEHLGQAAFAEAFAAGRRLNLDELIDLGLRHAGTGDGQGRDDA